MFQLVVVVLAIALAAVFVMGGITYVSPEREANRILEARAETDARSARSAFRSYALANGGSLPSPDVAWDVRIKPFLPEGDLPAPRGFVWSYVLADPSLGGRPHLCLRSQDPADQPQIATALERVAASDPSLFTASDCSGLANGVADHLIVEVE